MPRPKKIKIIERKLGRERADAQIFIEKRKIEIDERLSPKEKFAALIHEILHLIIPEWDEDTVLKKEKIVLNILWDENYRKVNNK